MTDQSRTLLFEQEAQLDTTGAVAPDHPPYKSEDPDHPPVEQGIETNTDTFPTAVDFPDAKQLDESHEGPISSPSP